MEIFTPKGHILSRTLNNTAFKMNMKYKKKGKNRIMSKAFVWNSNIFMRILFGGGGLFMIFRVVGCGSSYFKPSV